MDWKEYAQGLIRFIAILADDLKKELPQHLDVDYKALAHQLDEAYRILYRVLSELKQRREDNSAEALRREFFG